MCLSDANDHSSVLERKFLSGGVEGPKLLFKTKKPIILVNQWWGIDIYTLLHHNSLTDTSSVLTFDPTAQ